jgi:tripartite-type tricarboxylate transporter receptor subunit TctC
MMGSRLLIGAFILAAVASSCGSGLAQHYPSKHPIRLLVPLSAGSPTDIIARQISSVVEKLINQSIVIENKVGGGSSIAAAALIQSPADGYTLLFGSSQISAAPALIRDLTFNPQTDFTPILRLAVTPTFLAVNASLPITSIADLVAYAKSHPDILTFASTGQGTSSHLQGTMLSTLAEIKTRHIPYRLASQAVTDVATGEVSFMWFTYQAFEPFVQSGKIRVIAVNGDKRVATLPDIPTMRESGFKDFAPSGTWFGLFGPAGLDPRIAEKLQDVFSSAMKDPALISGFQQQHVLPFLADSKSFSVFISDEIARYKVIAESAGIAPQ